jgi:hypothetical protein
MTLSDQADMLVGLALVISAVGLVFAIIDLLIDHDVPDQDS